MSVCFVISKEVDIINTIFIKYCFYYIKRTVSIIL